MNDKQTLKLALEAFEKQRSYFLDRRDEAPDHVYEAITAIRQALAVPVQEPVAWEQYAIKFAKGRKLTYGKPENLPSYIGVRALVYADTTPPAAQRQWIGLTDEEIDSVQRQYIQQMMPGSRHFARAIEAKLKEKNS